MASYPFCIDEFDVVHHRFCGMAVGKKVPYGSLAATSEDMIEHLARPDVANNHSAPSMLRPCQTCILGEADDE